MWKRVRRLLGRPPTGRNFYQYSVNLTLAETEFLKKNPNASEQVRKLIDSVISAQPDFNVKLPILALKHAIDNLEEHRAKADKEFTDYVNLHWREIWKDVGNQYDGTTYTFDETGTKVIGEKPMAVKDTDEARYHFKVWKTLKDQCDMTEAQIKKLKDQVTATT